MLLTAFITILAAVLLLLSINEAVLLLSTKVRAGPVYPRGLVFLVLLLFGSLAGFLWDARKVVAMVQTSEDQAVVWIFSFLGLSGLLLVWHARLTGGGS